MRFSCLCPSPPQRTTGGVRLLAIVLSYFSHDANLVDTCSSPQHEPASNPQLIIIKMSSRIPDKQPTNRTAVKVVPPPPRVVCVIVGRITLPRASHKVYHPHNQDNQTRARTERTTSPCRPFMQSRVPGSVWLRGVMRGHLWVILLIVLHTCSRSA